MGLIMHKKSEYLPHVGESNYLLISMQSIKEIKSNLKKFPSSTGIDGCVGTLLWSGIKGNNIPVTLNPDRSLNQFGIGVVLNPEQLKIPQGDLSCATSDGQLQVEVFKKDAITRNIFGVDPCVTRNKSKRGYYQKTIFGDSYTTNLAKYEKKPDQAGVSNDEGTPSVLAGNIWRKYFNNKRNHHRNADNVEIMHQNRALCFRKEKQNPIVGFVITQYIDKNTAQVLKRKLEENPLLNLYFYDVTAKEHIVRYFDNTKAKAYFDNIIQQGQTEEEFKLAFERALPFNGFNIPAVDQKKEPWGEQPSKLMQILNPGTFTAWLKEKLPQIENPSANLETMILIADKTYRQLYNSLKKNNNFNDFSTLAFRIRDLLVRDLYFSNSDAQVWQLFPDTKDSETYILDFIKDSLRQTISNEKQRIIDWQFKGFKNIPAENKAYVTDQLAIILKKIQDNQKDVNVLTDLADFLVALNTALEEPTKTNIAECKQLAESTIGGYSWGSTILGATLIILGLLTMALAPVVSITTTAASFGLSAPLSIIGGVSIGASGLSMFSSGVYWLQKGLQKTPEVDEVLELLNPPHIIS
jgi:hypothetical protein